MTVGSVVMLDGSDYILLTELNISGRKMAIDPPIKVYAGDELSVNGATVLVSHEDGSISTGTASEVNS